MGWQVTGKVCHTASPHYNSLTLLFPALVTTREKVSKNTSKPLPFVRKANGQLSQNFPFTRDHVTLIEARKLRWWRYPTMQCRDLYSTSVQGSLWAQMERSHVQTTPRLACRLSYAAALDPPLSSPAGLVVKFTHHPANTERRITSNSHSNFYHWAVDYNCWKCDSLLHLGGNTICHDVMKINSAPISAAYWTCSTFKFERSSFRKMCIKCFHVRLYWIHKNKVSFSYNTSHR